MKIALSMLGLCLIARAQTVPTPRPDPAPVPERVAIIEIQNAIFGTKEGQKAVSEIQSKFAPRKAALDQKRQEIAQLQERLRQGSSAMSEEAKESLARSIDQKSRLADREAEDDQSDYDEALRSTMQQIGSRLMPLLTKYAKENGYSMLLDVGSQQTPVVYAAEGIDITGEVIALYDKSNPAPASVPSAPPKK